MKTKKLKTLFFCSECGASSPKWQGQCSNCGKWNCLIEEPSSPSFSPFKTVKQKPTMLSQQFPKSTTRV
ncbi:MAG: hypothetical protein OXH36_02070, partial [Bdellovibrionales bacterium]|nr:hypothetical protein [Bdellovibrionales bacterium]